LPLIRIDARRGMDVAKLKGIHEGIHRGFIDVMGIPEGDYFHITTLHDADELQFDQKFLGVERENVVFIEVVMVQGRGRDEKARLFRAISDNLGRAGVRPDDVFVCITENHREDWAAGKLD
jgi:4-oxalocrotonate tautomerase